MGWMKKTAKSAKKTAKKTVKKSTKVVVDTTEDVAKATAKAAEDTYDAAADLVDDAVDWMVDSVDGLSKAAKDLADKALKELKRIGDLALALLDEIFLAALEAFVDQLISDYSDAIDDAINAVKTLAKDPDSVTKVLQAVADLTAVETVTNEAKDLFVDVTKYTPIPAFVRAVKGLGFDCISVGGQVDGGGAQSGGVGSNSRELHDAYEGKLRGRDVPMAAYYAEGDVVGSASGAGVEIGAWRGDSSKLDGDWIGVSVGASYQGGVELEIYVSTSIDKFLGLNVVPQTGTGVDFAVALGETQTVRF